MSRRYKERQSSIIAIVVLTVLVALSCWTVSALPEVHEVILTETTPSGEFVMELSSFTTLETLVHPIAGNILTLTVILEPLEGLRVFQLNQLHHIFPTETSPKTLADSWSWSLSTALNEFSNTNFAIVANEMSDPDFVTKDGSDFFSGVLAASVDVQAVATPEPVAWILLLTLFGLLRLRK